MFTELLRCLYIFGTQISYQHDFYRLRITIKIIWEVSRDGSRRRGGGNDTPPR